ncbi:MAG TPA: RteC domain-containing protein [Cyclobacteriaceae bacterium]|nr:RteC domain-containing protein [Cyclobacteriaceae bacterium]
MKHTELNNDQVLANLHKKLELIHRDHRDPLLKARASYELTKEITTQLVRTNPVGKDRVNFNKIIFPKFLSLLIYYHNEIVIRSGEPVGKPRQKIKYFNRLIKKIQSFYSEHSHLISYCRSGSIEQDQVLFDHDFHDQILLDANPVYIWSKYLANQKLTALIFKELEKLNGQQEPSQLSWTAPKTSLIELMYALHANKVFNDGEADLKLIANALEQQFSVSLGNYYRVFQDIRQRKMNQTVFLDQLKEKFLQRVHELE